jgi:hypothetical protein
LTASDESPGLPDGAPRPSHPPTIIDLTVPNPIAPDQVVALCERIRLLLMDGNVDGVTVACEPEATAAADVVMIEALARMQLIARRLGCSIRVHNAPPGLRDLLALAGLVDIVPLTGLTAGSVDADRRQCEEREQAHLEKGVDGLDPPG